MNNLNFNLNTLKLLYTICNINELWIANTLTVWIVLYFTFRTIRKIIVNFQPLTFFCKQL